MVVFMVKGPCSKSQVVYVLPVTLWSFWESKKEK